MRRLNIIDKRLKLVALFILLMTTVSGYAQREITGVVVDDEGEPLIGAVVKVSDSKGSVTDLDGKFVINVDKKDQSLQVSYIGYKTNTVKLVSGKNVYKIVLQLEATTIDDVVVIGYGAVKKGDVTAAVSKIDGDELEDRPVTNTADLLQGQLAGVEISSNSGMPGGKTTVNVRGSVTLNDVLSNGDGDQTDNTAPLYVVDGIPMDDEFDMSQMEAHDIASIEVLKDASSSAIYGSRGANGVIIITTKKPDKTEKVSITASANYSLQQVTRKVGVMSGNEWSRWVYNMNNQRYIDKYGDIGAEESDGMLIRTVLAGHSNFDALNAGTTQTYMYDPRWVIPGHPGLSYIDWQEAAYHTAPQQQYSVSASGSNKQSNFRVSVNYTNQDGIIRGTGYERFSATAQGQAKIDRFTFGISISPTLSVFEAQAINTAQDSKNLTILSMVPVAESEAGVNTAAYPYNYYAFSSSSSSNPILRITKSRDERQLYQMRSNAFVKVDVIDGMTAEVTGTWNMRQQSTRSFVPSTLQNLHTFNANGGEGQNTTSSWADTKNQYFALQTILNYNKTFGKHSINGMLGWTISSTKWADKSSSSVEDFINDASEGYTNTSVTINKLANNYSTPTKMISYFGRGIYNYNNRYVVNVSLRRDGSSRFGENTRWATFPSISANWRISNESFWPKGFFMNLLKFRMSYGQNGRSNIRTNAVRSALSSAIVYFNGVEQKGYKLGSVGNPDLGWQKTDSWDIALDIGMFKNRISMSIDYYIKNTSSMLYQMELASVSGFDRAYFNIGKIRNYGIDIEMKTINIVKPFKWTSSLNLGFQRNKVLDLGGNDRIMSGTTAYGSGKTQILEVGHRVGDYYLYDYMGVFTSQEDLDSYPHVATAQVGGIKVRDVNSDGIIDENDRIRCGNPRPDITIGFSNRFTYKNWDLSFLITSQWGGKLFAGQVGTKGLLDHPQGSYAGLRNMMSSYENMWYSEENPGDGQTPAAWLTNSGYNFGGTTHNLYSTDYIKLKNVTLSYRFKIPKNKLVKSLSLLISIENALQWDKYDIGYSPESSAIQNSSMSAYDLVAYPTARVYSLGLKFGM
ncbi:MAG: TonB-dependent receptor [Prevotella sp.]|nr:TonB-dependent receptor [Prevotella sp.]